MGIQSTGNLVIKFFVFADSNDNFTVSGPVYGAIELHGSKLGCQSLEYKYEWIQHESKSTCFTKLLPARSTANVDEFLGTTWNVSLSHAAKHDEW